MNKCQTQSYKNSLKNFIMKSSKSQHLSSSPLSTLSQSSSSIHSSPFLTPYEQQESNKSNIYSVFNKITDEFDLMSFDDEPPPTLSNINITNKTFHLLDDTSSGFNQVKHILDDDSQMKISQHILDNDNELENQKHILDDDYDLFCMKNSQTYENDYNEYDENFENEELQSFNEGIEEVEEKNWKEILEFTIPNSLEYAREFCKTVS
ncbi:hypothetical protein C1645_506099 [Glomus cerebriforme]|uniref:Uncharacterized protein n=1 Tax=Glomus cerebriforme TaxID=658196 RepID=A0A397TA07_9GLOM|nr:hypothetical protein C1645_506099 [Glomus cerebriforme]